MSATVAIPAPLAAELLGALGLPVETAFTGSSRLVDAGDGSMLLLSRQLTSIDEAAYLERDWNRLSIRSEGWVPNLSLAEQDQAVPLLIHTHPGGSAAYSPADQHMDAEFRSTAFARGTEWCATVVVGGTPDAPTISGRLWCDGVEAPIPIDRLRVVGRRLVLGASETTEVGGAYDRNIRAFGADGQRILIALRVGVVGAGGTGSAVVEELSRLGVIDLVVIDGQHLEDTNATRVVGSDATADLGVAKAAVAERNARRANPASRARGVVGDITTEAVARELTDRDVIFCCTDDNRSRMVLNRFPYRLLVPVIDCGVVLDSDHGVLNAVFMRTTRISVGDPCLICAGRVDPVAARHEALHPDEQARLAGEGYAPELPGPAPAVVAYTTMTASLAVHALLDMLFGLSETDASDTLLMLGTEDRISHAMRPRNPAHFCSDHDQLAAGAGTPFLGTSWVA